MQECWKPCDLVKNKTLRGLAPSAARAAGVHPPGMGPSAKAAAAAATAAIASRRVIPSEHLHMELDLLSSF
jgi:hypothetical protein